MPQPMHYATLGVGQNATAKEIKQAFRRLAHRHSPDTNCSPESEGQFWRIMEAYEILGKPAKRAEYDACFFEAMFTTNGQRAPQPPQRAREAAADAKAYADAIAAVNAKAAKARAASIVGRMALCTPTEAAAIMGLNFIGTNDVENHFFMHYTPKQLSLLNVVPFSAQELQECADTHILIPGCGQTIKEMFFADPDAFSSEHTGWIYHYGFYAKDNDDEYDFATTARVAVGWHLVRKSPSPNTFWQSWYTQQAGVIPPWTIPPADLMIQTVISHCLVTGVHLLSEVYARTSSTNGNRQVSVGLFDFKGLHFDADETPLFNVGVAEERMPNQSYRR